MTLRFQLKSGRAVTFQCERMEENHAEVEMLFHGDIKPTSSEMEEAQQIVSVYYAAHDREVTGFKETAPMEYHQRKESQN